MKKIYALCLSLFAVLCLMFTPSQTFALSNCSPLYNGGITNQQHCITPTPNPENANSGRTTIVQRPTPITPQQTKGGQRVFPSSQSKTTPSTGPEEWSLPVLFLFGGFGFWLRKKTKLI